MKYDNATAKFPKAQLIAENYKCVSEKRPRSSTMYVEDESEIEKIQESIYMSPRGDFFEVSWKVLSTSPVMVQGVEKKSPKIEFVGWKEIHE